MGASWAETDISGRPLPHGRQGTPLQSVLAVPPVRDVANDQSTELLLSAYSTILIGGAPLALFFDAAGTVPAVQIDQQYRGRIDALMLFVPDMVAAAAPYLFFSLFMNGAAIDAWNNVPIWPRDGVASLSFDAVISIPARATITALVSNTGAASHFVGLYLHGWLWPKDLKETGQ